MSTTKLKRRRKKPFRMLQDYRTVYKAPSADGGSEVQKALREMFKADPGKFLATMHRMEAEFRDRPMPPPRDPDNVKVDDDGGLEVVEEWLRERLGKRAGNGPGDTGQVAASGGAVHADGQGQ